MCHDILTLHIKSMAVPLALNYINIFAHIWMILYFHITLYSSRKQDKYATIYKTYLRLRTTSSLPVQLKSTRRNHSQRLLFYSLVIRNLCCKYGSLVTHGWFLYQRGSVVSTHKQIKYLNGVASSHTQEVENTM